jgi:hypothetical protein
MPSASRSESLHHKCLDLQQFTFQPIDKASPPAEKGIYVIRVAKAGQPIEGIIEAVKALTRQLHWPLVEKKALNRMRRLERIASCPILYIGAAGPSERSKHTLEGRYRDFAGRHTIMLPLWALAYFGWQLEYGWLATSSAAPQEASLKSQYRFLHAGNLPALVSR